MAFPGRPQPNRHRGNCSDLEECKRRFKAVARIRTGLSGVGIKSERGILAADDRRTSNPAALIAFGTQGVLQMTKPTIEQKWRQQIEEVKAEAGKLPRSRERDALLKKSRPYQ